MDEQATIADIERRLAAAEAALRAKADVEVVLRQSEELRRIAVEGGRMGTWRWNLRDELIWGDAAFLSLWGFPPSDEPRPLSDFTDRMSPQGRAEMGEMVTRAIASGEEFDGQLAVVSGPTNGHWVRWRGRAERERPWIVNGMSFDVTDQRVQEQRLRESEARHRLLVESWAQAVWETDAAGVVVADSPSWRAYTGQTLEEWLGYGWLDAIHPDDRAYAERQWREAVAARGLVNAEFRLRAPDGGWRWTNVRAAPVLDARGAIEKWAGMNIDIDARKRAEAALRESEERYHALFASMDEAYAVVDVLKDGAGAWVDFRFIEVNPAFIAHTSMPWPVGRTATELLGEPNRRWTQLYGQALDTGEAIRVEEAEPTLDRVFDLNIFTLDRDRNRVAVLFTNITERKRTEAALRESEERYRSLFEQIDEGYCIIEMIFNGDAAIDYRFLDVNPAFEGHTGIHEAKGRLMREIAPDHEPFWFDRYGEVALTGRPHRFEAQAMALGGRWFEANAFRIGAPERRRVAIVFSDITGRKLAEAELRESAERNRLLVDLVPAMLWSTDPEGRIVAADQEWQHRTGRQADEVQAFGWLDAIHPEDRKATRAAFAHAFATGEPLDCQQRIRQRRGGYRWHLVRHVPVRGTNGAITRWFGAAIDIHELHELQSRQEILVNELQHRSRNLLGVITAVADRTVKRGGSVEAFEERLQALSRVQGLLSQGASDTVEVGALVRAELAAHADGAEDRLTTSGPTVRLTARQMQNFALALHELTTDAVKYGALKSDTGRLTISWDVVLDRRERRRLALNWVESGVAIESQKITRRGFGTELIQEALAYALEAEVDYELGADGVRCRIEMPIS